MKQATKSPGATPGPWKYADGRVILAGAVDADGYAVDPVIVAEAFREAQYKDGRPNPIAPWERDANLQRIVECVNKGVGLFLWGDTRTGKTCAAAIVAKTAAAHGGKVYFTRADEMIHAVMERERFINGTTETTIEKRVLEVDLLVIDELSEPADIKEKRVIERIIRQRQDRQRATVLTTNLTKDALRNAYGEPFLQAVEEHTVRLPVFGVNWHEMGKDRMSTFLMQGPQGGAK